ncbi:MAG: hypothetical protein SGILL_001770 [Bacillariaceae sp.]
MKSSDKMTGKIIECHPFVPMKDDANDQNGTSYFELVKSTSLRNGKYVMLGGFPCRIKEVNIAKPGKHGHAKATVVGHGIFDGKRRETIYHDTAPSPIVKKYQDIPCQVQGPSMMKTLQQVHSSMPGFLSIPPNAETESRQASETVKIEGEPKPFALVSLMVSCGHYKMTAVRYVDKVQVAKDEKGPGAASDSSAPVLSKKDARKQKKLLKKQQKEAKEATAAKAEAQAAAE